MIIRDDTGHCTSCLVGPRKGHLHTCQHVRELRVSKVDQESFDRDPEIQLLVYPNSEFQAQCGCRWMSPKSVLQQTVYGYAEDHHEETGHQFATGGDPIENGSGD